MGVAVLASLQSRRFRLWPPPLATQVHGSEQLGESKYLNINDYHAPQKGETAPALDPNHTHHILVSGEPVS